MYLRMNYVRIFIPDSTKVEGSSLDLCISLTHVLLPGIEPGFFLPQRNVLSVERRELTFLTLSCPGSVRNFPKV